MVRNNYHTNTIIRKSYPTLQGAELGEGVASTVRIRARLRVTDRDRVRVTAKLGTV